MKKNKNQQYYKKKLESIEILESNNYKVLEKMQKQYKERGEFYKIQKDDIGTKIRMLEVYQNLWLDLESQITGQAFLNEEFWNNITFNILKYNKFIQELNELDYSKKTKNSIDKKINEELWNQRQQAFISMKNDINFMNSNFNKMHSDIHKRALIQRKCIEKHIEVMETKYEEIEEQKEVYKQTFYEVQKELGTKGNKISRQALNDYKIALLQKAEYVTEQLEEIEFDLAW